MNSMDKDVIYKIQSPIGKVYIGRTNNFIGRMHEHKCNALTKHSKNSIHKAIRKYGWDNMIKEIICEVDSDQSQKIEEQLILAYNSVKTGYNDTYVGGGGDMWKDRKETTEYTEWIDKMTKINSGESNGMYGKTHTDETMNLMKSKAKGRFTLHWFIDRYGLDDGTTLYNDRYQQLKNRKLKTDETGRFVSSK
jgi:group I intron endonuclease